VVRTVMVVLVNHSVHKVQVVQRHSADGAVVHMLQRAQVGGAAIL
jgi:hypothetical protein